MVGNVAGFRRYMRRIPRAIRTAAERAVEEEAASVAAVMASRAPRDMGELIASTKSEARHRPGAAAAALMSGDATTFVFTKSGGQFQNARLQEFGTKRMRANPYFYPTWRAEKRRAKGRITRRVKKAILAI